MLHLKYLLTLENCYVPQKKCDPLTTSAAASIAPAAINTVGSLVSSLFGQSSQKEENAINRGFAVEMFNRANEYNSPKNQRKLLEEGGYSPYLFNDTAPFSTAGNTPSPNTAPLPTFQNPMQGSMQLLQQGLQIEANADLQRMKSLDTLSDIMIKLYREGGQSQLDDFMQKFAPVFDSLNWSGSHAESYFNEFLADEKSKRYNLDMNSLKTELETELAKKYTPMQIEAGLEKTQYDISEIVGRLQTMNVQNEALMKRTAADCIESLASAFNLRKSGEKYEADTKTANLFRNTLHRIIKGEATIKERNAFFASADMESASELVGYMTSGRGRHARSEAYRIPLERKADALWTAVDKTFSDYIKVNSGGSAGSYGQSTNYFGSENSSSVFGW